MQKLYRWFIIWFSATVLFLLIYALFGPKGKPIDWGKVDYEMSNSSRLYFKNMRSYFYDLESFQEDSYLLYRIKSRKKEDVKIKMSFVLIQNLLQDAAFIRLESEVVDLDQENILVSWQNNQEVGELALTSFSNEAHYQFSAQLYNLLVFNSRLWLQLNSGRIELSEKEKKSLRKSLNDYFKLVGKLR